MNIEKNREEFEAWAAQNSYVMKTDGEGYYHHQTQTAWDGWMASRAALVIELPALSEFYPDQYCSAVAIDEGSDLAIIECREAIETAGVKVKP